MFDVVFVGLSEVAIVLGLEVDLDTMGAEVLERVEDVDVGNEVCTVCTGRAALDQVPVLKDQKLNHPWG